MALEIGNDFPLARLTTIRAGGSAEHFALADVDAVVMRKDPPFDSEYFYATHLLEQLSRGEDAVALPLAVEPQDVDLAVGGPGLVDETLQRLL